MFKGLRVSNFGYVHEYIISLEIMKKRITKFFTSMKK